MERGEGWTARLAGRVDLVMAAVFLVGGWLFILVVNRWHVAAPVVFLGLGWLAVVLCATFFLRSARAAAGEGTGPEEEGFELSAGRAVELEKEKKLLLKAIKEVEFDREMGKMSEADAEEIARLYRARAIDILKELDGAGERDEVPASTPLSDVIDREVRARLVLAGVSDKRPKAAPAANSEPAKAASSEPAEVASSEPAEAAAPVAESVSEVDAETEADPADPETDAEPSAANGKSAGRSAGLEKREDA